MTGLLGKFFSKKRSTKRKRSSNMVMPINSSVVQRIGQYHSKQMHSEFVNGVTEERQQIVDINGKKGTKTVIVTRNGNTRKSTKSLSKKEMACIRKCEFVPGLFKQCDECIRLSALD